MPNPKIELTRNQRAIWWVAMSLQITNLTLMIEKAIRARKQAPAPTITVNNTGGNTDAEAITKALREYERLHNARKKPAAEPMSNAEWAQQVLRERDAKQARP